MDQPNQTSFVARRKRRAAQQHLDEAEDTFVVGEDVPDKEEEGEDQHTVRSEDCKMLEHKLRLVGNRSPEREEKEKEAVERRNRGNEENIKGEKQS